MSDLLPHDAWIRYVHVRSELAAVDAKIQVLDVEAMMRRGLIDDPQIAAVCDLLDEQAAVSKDFSASAQHLGDSLHWTGGRPA